VISRPLLARFTGSVNSEGLLSDVPILERTLFRRPDRVGSRHWVFIQHGEFVHCSELTSLGHKRLVVALNCRVRLA